MIDVSHISKLYGKWTAVHDLSFSIASGQCVGLLGPNGAGKSTTLRMIVGYLPPSSGKISVCTFDSVNQSLSARRVIGYLPESTPLHPEMRVIDFLRYRAGLFGLSRRDSSPHIEKAMRLCRVDDVRTRRVGQLSKGYKQRVGMAAALVHDPKVLILDEPTSGLDPTQIRETRSLIRDLAHRRTVLVSSHILPEVEKTCDRVLIMARGRLRADGSPAQLTGVRASCITEYRANAHADDAMKSLAARVGSVNVHFDDQGEGWRRATFVGVAGPTAHSLREAIGAAVTAAGASPRELRVDAPSLEQVFVNIIESDQESEHLPGTQSVEHAP